MLTVFLLKWLDVYKELSLINLWEIEIRGIFYIRIITNPVIDTLNLTLFTSQFVWNSPHLVGTVEEISV